MKRQSSVILMALLLAAPKFLWGQGLQIDLKEVGPTYFKVGVKGTPGSEFRAWEVVVESPAGGRELESTGWISQLDSVAFLDQEVADPPIPLRPVTCITLSLFAQVDTMVVGYSGIAVRTIEQRFLTTAAMPPIPLQYEDITATSVEVRWDHTPNTYGQWCDETPVRYWAECIFHSNENSGWLKFGNLPVEKSWVASELEPNSRHRFQVKAMNLDSLETLWQELGEIRTLPDRQLGIGTTLGVPPWEYALAQNYPNPFNPETAIKYQLPVAGHVRLSIYTVLGQEVRRLIDRSQEAAYHVVVWDGWDNDGNTLPSGVYFYRLESGGFMAMKKMIMMK